MKRLFTIAAIASALSANAQIGYQVSLLDNATGEPRADETVTVEIAITDSNGKTLCSERKSATTNDFGVLSLTVGNSSTFTDADWSALPFFISATVDGTLIGRSQILNVPVAEYAKQTNGVTKDILCSKTWRYSDDGYSETLRFSRDGTASIISIERGQTHSSSSKYDIVGYTVVIIGHGFYIYSPTFNCLEGELNYK